MGAVFAHGHVDVIERLAHDQFQFLVHFGVEPVSTGQILGPLKIADRDSARIGQNIRDYEDPFTGENLVGMRRRRPIGPFGHNFGLHLVGIMQCYGVFQRRGDENVAFEREQVLV